MELTIRNYDPSAKQDFTCTVSDVSSAGRRLSRAADGVMRSVQWGNLCIKQIESSDIYFFEFCREMAFILSNMSPASIYGLKTSKLSVS